MRKLNASRLQEFGLSAVLCLLFFYMVMPTESEGTSLSSWVRLASAMGLLSLFLFFVFPVRQIIVNSYLALSLVVSIAALSSFSFRYVVSLSAVAVVFSWLAAMNSSALVRKSSLIAIEILIYVSCGFLLIQLVGYYFFGRLFEFHSLFFPWSDARVEEMAHVALARMGGLYIEPGTFSNWVYGLFLLLVFLRRNIPASLGMLVGACMVFTLSAWGMLVGLLIMVISAVAAKKKRLVVMVFGVVALWVVFGFVFNENVRTFLEAKLNLNTGSGLVRVIALEEFRAIWPSLLVFGRGFDPQFCVGCVAAQDVGVIILFSVVYGLFFAGVFFGLILLYAYQIGRVPFLLLTTFLVTTKFYYWDYILWLIFGVALFGVLSLARRSQVRSVDSGRQLYNGA